MSAAPWWCRCLALLKRKYIWSQCTVIQLREDVDINWNTESTVQLIDRLIEYFAWFLCVRYLLLYFGLRFDELVSTYFGSFTA